MPAVCWRVVDRSTSANCRGLGTSLPTRHRGKYSQILFWWVACCRAFWHIFFLSFYVCRTWALTESLLSPSSPYWWTPPKTLQRTCRLKKDWDPTYPMTFPTSCLPWSSLASATPRRTDSKCFYNYSHNSLTLSIYYYCYIYSALSFISKNVHLKVTNNKRGQQTIQTLFFFFSLKKNLHAKGGGLNTCLCSILLRWKIKPISCQLLIWWD